MRNKSGFTLMELMITVMIIGILIAIGVVKYQDTVRKSTEGATKGSLSGLRSALSIYFGDNDQDFPQDDLTSLTIEAKYLPAIPLAKMPPYHGPSAAATPETTPTDSGQWSYNNDRNDINWGQVKVGCLHQDVRGQVWTTY